MTLIIPIDADTKRTAEIHSLERMKYEYNRFGLNDIIRYNMILIGTIGQLLFKKLLDDNGINYIFEFQAGNYDNLDFKINNKIIEIKTSGFENNYQRLNLLYSEDQYQRGLYKKYDYCVLIFINGYIRNQRILELDKCNNGIIAGYLEYKNISRYRQTKRYLGDDYKVPLSDLKNIQILLDYLVG